MGGTKRIVYTSLTITTLCCCCCFIDHVVSSSSQEVVDDVKRCRDLGFASRDLSCDSCDLLSNTSVSLGFVNMPHPGFVTFGNLRFAILDGDFGNYLPQTPLVIDYLILRDNPKLELENLSKQYNFMTLVFDASNSFWNRSKWRAFCDSAGLSYHDVNKDGYLEIDL